MGALWGHCFQLAHHKLPDVVAVLILHDAPELAANEVVVFEVLEQLQSRGIHHDELLRFTLHAVTAR